MVVVFFEENHRRIPLIEANNRKECSFTPKRVYIAALIIFSTLPFLAFETGAFSDQTGVYARVDKVGLEPNATAPERIQIRGAFSFASKDDRISYETAQRGYLYFSCKSGQVHQERTTAYRSPLTRWGAAQKSLILEQTNDLKLR